MWYCRWRNYIEQNNQGYCPHCGAKVMDFLGPSSNKKANFKNVLGYSLDSGKKGDITLLSECPKCFERSYFHVSPDWIEYYPWLKNIDTNKVLKGKARKAELRKAKETCDGIYSALGRKIK